MKLSIHCSRCKEISEVEFISFGKIDLKIPKDWLKMSHYDYSNDDHGSVIPAVVCNTCAVQFHNVMKDYLHIGVPDVTLT